MATTELSAMPPRVDLVVPRYGAVPFTITVTMPAWGTPVDLTGKTLTFALKEKRGDSDLAALLIKDSAGRGGITLTDAPAGVALLSFTGTEFADMSKYGEGTPYRYGIKLYPDDVEVVSGSFTILSSVIAGQVAP